MTLKVPLVDIAARHGRAADAFRDGAAFAGEAAWSLVYCKPIFVGTRPATPAKESAR